MSPLETQVREHHLQLRRRLDSIKRIHHASGELEERIARARAAGGGARARRSRDSMQEVAAIDAIVQQPDALPLAANA